MSRLDSAELTEWIAYSRLEPFGPLHEDIRAGLIASTIANVHRGKKAKAYKPDDFMASLKAENRRNEPSVPKKLREFFAAYERNR